MLGLSARGGTRRRVPPEAIPGAPAWAAARTVGAENAEMQPPTAR
jgi:hypothetical protein